MANACRCKRGGSHGLRWVAVSWIMMTAACLTSCGDPAPKESIAAADNPGRIPYQVDLECASTLVHDRGATPEKQIADILPGGLKIGLKADDLERNTDWVVRSKSDLDNTKWYNIEIRSNNGPYDPEYSGTAVDMDLNGTLDWIRVGSSRGETPEKIRRQVKKIDGGRFSKNERPRFSPGSCNYRQRHVFTPAVPTPNDADLGEEAFCAARTECRIADRPLCGRRKGALTLVVDDYGNGVWMTLRGNGSFRPAWDKPHSLPKTAPVCDSNPLVNQRSWL